jgi:transcriptional regulator with XRE-family HTH domain
MAELSAREQERTEHQEALAERLREAREYLGLSQEFVAKHTGISRAAVSAIENGKRKVEAVELTALASLYKYPVTYFLDGALEEPAAVRAIARAAATLTDTDREQVLQFAQFLKAYGNSKGNRSTKPALETESGD